jgi:SAM-dependent methyltransferase
MNVSFWDERYKEEGYAYGSEPNAFIASELQKLNTGSILLPAEGEGRNAVYAAQLGWDVDAFDLSEAGREKALLLSSQHHVTMNYQVCDATSFLSIAKASYDAIVFCFTHFPGPNRIEEHKGLASLVKPGGIAIMEVFAKGHTTYNTNDPRVGGPKDETMLFDLAEAHRIFQGFEMILCEEKEVYLREGKYHQGLGKVLRVVAKRIG